MPTGAGMAAGTAEPCHELETYVARGGDRRGVRPSRRRLRVGCLESDARWICGRSGAAELCLVGGPSSYRIEAEGFEAGSEATLTMGNGGRPIAIHIDATGREVTAGAGAGVLGGPDPQEVVVTGTTSGGEPVESALTVPAIQP